MAAYYIEALMPPDQVVGDWRWNDGSPIGTAASVTYSFMQDPTGYFYPADPTGFQPFSAAQQQAVREILSMYAGIANITFTEVNDAAIVNPEAAPELQMHLSKLRFANNNLGDSGSAGYTYLPSLYYDFAGDVWLNAFYNTLPPVIGRTEYVTLIHEIAHGLGLKHPGNYNGMEDGPFLPAADDTDKYTVMSYISRGSEIYRDVIPTGPGTYSFDFYRVEPDTPMLYDIAALQYLYGANMNTRTGNDTYTFDPLKPFFRTLWDAGGNDTISIANFSRGSTIDLRAGHYSSIIIPPDKLPPGFSGGTTPTYTGVENLAIAFGVTIENATGGRGADRLIGNEAANGLTGGLGADTMTGGLGNDLYVVSDTGDVIIELGGQGVDTVKASVSHVLAAEVEKLTLVGSAGISGTGNALNNTLLGNLSGNALEGGAGNDLIYGKGGNDTLTGGLGADKFYFDTAPAPGNVDLVSDFSRAERDKFVLDDDVFAAIGPVGVLAAGAFKAGTQATLASHRIIYDGASGALYYDVDGSGAAAKVQFATVGAVLHPVLKYTDFTVLA